MKNANTLPKFESVADASSTNNPHADKELEITATMLEIDQIDDQEIFENERLIATVNLIREVRYRLGLPRAHF